MIATALLMNGCALLPEDGVRAKVMAMPDMQQTLKPDQDAEKWVQAWPGAQWWQSFHNTELARLLNLALQGSPTLKAANARVSQAEAMADYRAADLLPGVEARADFHTRHFSGKDFYGPAGDHTFTGAYVDPFLFRYHLDLWGKDRAALEAALGKARAQAAELAVVRLMLSTSIARGYFRLCSVEEEIQLSAALTANAEKQLRLAKQRWDSGLDSQDGFYAKEQKLAVAHQREASLHTEAQLLRNRLAALAGQGPDWGKSITVTETRYAEQFPMPKNLGLGLLAHRPDVAAALWQVEAAAQTMKIAKTNFYPDVNLVGFTGLRSLDLKDLFASQGASVAYSIGPTVTLPIFEGGRLEAELAHEQAGYDGAVASYNNTLLAAVQQVADALAHWRESRLHDQAQERALAAAKQQAGLAATRYQAGISTRDGELDADDNLLEQRLKLSQLAAEHLQSAVRLIEALGGGYEREAGDKPS
ncbi:MAG: efflux transporter outer membrane subunit [Methylovulum sp.]|uniref:efflux transporter outer membrane subunit n=1 Tax=Methylovulum sp. TaxID=1916980 RepID=UPI002631ED06|nr:efflux transporter outer membrane subunit [Methylovulum sp.]MDD2725216.1 efflux transporter outer membrane subunit [Methylovulum sp.]MDD5126040.1 efflux transporter outer membrane subunit [Methylovulum sp.]